MVLAPRGWTTIEVGLVRQASELRVSGLTSRGAGSDQPPPAAPLRLDARREAQNLADAVVDVVDSAPATATLHARRDKMGVQLTLEMPGVPKAWEALVKPEVLDKLLVTDELLAVVSASSKALDVLQAQLASNLGKVLSFDFDEKRSVLSLRRSQADDAEVRALALGRYHFANHLWNWDWAETDAPTGPVFRACGSGVVQRGLAALYRPAYHCDEGLAHSAAGAIAVGLGARGLFRGPVDGGARLWAVLQLAPVAER